MSLANDESPYWLHSKVDIAYTLNALHKSRTIMTGRMEPAGLSFITVILEVNADSSYLLLDAPGNDSQREQIQNGNGLSLQGSMDGARIEFRSEQAALAELEGKPAIRLTLPQRILKVQRRAYFRASIPLQKPITCSVPFPNNSVLACQVVDIGLGGIALSASANSPELKAGNTYDKCQINLHEAGNLEVCVRIQHASVAKRDGNNSVRRYGCEFVGLRSAQETMIQRYVLQLERERRAAAANN